MRQSVRLALAILLASLAGCARSGGPATTDEFGDAGVAFVNGAKCLPIRSAEVLPARAVVTHPGSGSTDSNVIFTSELWQRFAGICGGCHVTGAYGNWSVTQSTFAAQVTADVVAQHIATDDPAAFMPPSASPNGKPFSQRTPDDPVAQLLALLDLWIQQGSPTGQFYRSPPAGGAVDGGTGPAVDGGAPAAPQGNYNLTPDQGSKLTNIGNCVPNKYVVGTDVAAMDRLDTLFARASKLPETLAETDLTSFESDTLARTNVISYVPAYPLWSDDAGKMRHVRTPRGQPIVFDKLNQRFQIPANTRFYKTFMKKVLDASGAETYRKIETRLILSRPDTTRPDGTIQQNALYGTYLWNETETAATLLQDPLRDGLPFTDRVITYITDEPRAGAITAATPTDLNLEYALDTASPPVRRHYAVPGSERCIACHMGSASDSFVLGFLPVQIATVPPGTSGVIETATGDELTQLQRLIDDKVIAGIDGAADVVPLEKTQLPRAPRNSYELTAQAYLLGNCSHCHNPRGFPSTKAPALKEVLNFLPSATGGIFQFPLDRVSPVRSRGIAQDVPIPYITPSLRDIPTAASSTYKVKYLVCAGDGEAGTNGWCPKASATPYLDFIDAPWRSLIYRNVDTPFDYVDDLTIFPHMPMNTPGYDCRAARILGDWMVSIPAVNASAALENNTPDSTSTSLDLAPQPYQEVLPDDPAYASAQKAAQKRLAQYHAGHRYGYCPNTADILDPKVLSGASQTPADVPIYDATADPPRLLMPQEGVPDRPNWVVTDQTDPAGSWLPRGIDWQKALVQHLADANGSGVKLADLQTVVDDLPTAALSGDVRTALSTPVPFALWQQKPACDFSGVPVVGSFQGPDRPVWMDYNANLDPLAPVFMQPAGAAIFTNICINCHGPQGDAKGLLADEISLMTGGSARVADFRSGLFGPPAAPGSNRAGVFGPAIPAGDLSTADDFGARYMAWMALGGTKVQIPPQLLQVVSTTQVAGVSRQRISVSGSPNMLQLAQQLCSNVLLSDAPNNFVAALGQLPGAFPVNWSGQSALIGSNGDAELWLNVCSLHNRPIVRVLVPGAGAPKPPLPLNPSADDWNSAWSGATQLFVTGQSLYWGDGTTADQAPVYPATAAVMDQRGRVITGTSPAIAAIGPGNQFPMCVREPPAGSVAHAAADALIQSTAANGTAGAVIPYCPPALFAIGTDANGNGVLKWRLASPTDSTGNLTFPDANKWALRGAINAGMAVFLYLDQLSKRGVAQPLYNQCELIHTAGASQP